MRDQAPALPQSLRGPPAFQQDGHARERDGQQDTQSGNDEEHQSNGAGHQCEQENRHHRRERTQARDEVARDRRLTLIQRRSLSQDDGAPQSDHRQGAQTEAQPPPGVVRPQRPPRRHVVDALQLACHHGEQPVRQALDQGGLEDGEGRVEHLADGQRAGGWIQNGRHPRILQV